MHIVFHPVHVGPKNPIFVNNHCSDTDRHLVHHYHVLRGTTIRSTSVVTGSLRTLVIIFGS